MGADGLKELSIIRGCRWVPEVVFHNQASLCGRPSLGPGDANLMRQELVKGEWMNVFIAEVASGVDAKPLQPLKDAMVAAGGSLTGQQKEADCFVLPWTDATAVAAPLQAMARDALRQHQTSGKPHLYIYPLSEVPVPKTYEFYLLAASVLPEEAAKAAAIVIGAPQDASCDV